MEPCKTCGKTDTGLFGNTRCACCRSYYCHECYATHWNGLIPMYQVTQNGEGSQFREKEEADAEYISVLRSLREQAMPHPFFSSPKDNKAKAKRFSEAASKLKYETVLITREEWDDIYGPNGTAVWMA